MPFNVAEVIRSARERHSGFTDSRVPNRICVPHLSDIQRELLSDIVDADPTTVLQEHTETFPLADFEAGVDVPDHLVILGASLATDTDVKPLEIIPWAQRNALNAGWRSGWMFNNRLVLRGSASDYTAWGSVVVAYVPIPTDFNPLTDLAAQNFVLPEIARKHVVDRLAVFMARRTKGALPKGSEPLDVREMADIATLSHSMLINGIRARAGNNVVRIMDVMPH